MLFLAIGVGVASQFWTSSDKIQINHDLNLDFGNFTKGTTVILNGKEYRATIMKKVNFEEAKEECDKLAGKLPWNRVEGLSLDEINTHWVEIQDETNLDDENLRECFQTVSHFSFLL